MEPAAARRTRIVEPFDRAVARLRRPWLFFVVLLVAGLGPATAFAVIAQLLGEPAGASARVTQSLLARTGAAVFIGVVLVPLVETALLWVAIQVLRAWWRNVDAAVIAAAIMLGLIHVPGGIFRLLAVAWPFFVWALVLASNRVDNKVAAFCLVWTLHGTHNAMVIAVLYNVAP